MSLGHDASRLPAEARARLLIDQQLDQAGWAVQDKKAMNLFAARGVAVREVTLKPGHGRADYLLYVDQSAVGVIEAKPEGTPLSGVEWQSTMYAEGLPAHVRLAALTTDGRLPFMFEASGTETHFTNGFDPDPRARRVFHFPKPATLGAILGDDTEHRTWRGKVRALPPLDEKPLRPAQITAINGVERSLVDQRYDRSLVQMATGAGKTYAAVTLSYRLLKHGGFHRILFLVDRNNLAKQTMAEYENYQTPDDSRKFTELYNVNRLQRGPMPDATSVAISTIQRVFMALRDEEVGDTDDPALDGWVPDAPVTVAYNPDLPPETFDLIIVDEAHRSIYGQWRGVLEYFDAHIVGLTATPGKQTFGFFKQNLVSEYTYPQSVADNVNVDFDIYRIKTQISEQGSTIEAGTVVPKVDRRTRAQRLEAIDDDLDYEARQLDRAVTATDQIRTVLETYRDRLFTEIFPGRSVVPKTLIFAKDDAHAEEIVSQVREVFGKGNDFAAKITYTARDAERQLAAFRTSAALRIAVTVDMIATGTDVKPLECVFFMRDVRSPQYFEQMKGRGARTIPDADFQAVTPDAKGKARFVLVDAVGVTEHEFVEPPLNRDRSISLAKLLEKAANLTITEDETATLASRLAALEAQITPEERDELDRVAGGSSTDIGASGDDGSEIFRQDFVVTTSNKQLNFLQHIMTILGINGRAGVVLPDNVLFEGGAGEALRRKLLTAFDFHTLLRLPTGIFYKPGVKANVLFFDKKPAAEQPWTQQLWVYDLRTNKHFTLKKSPLRRDDLDDFVSSCLPGEARSERVESERWKPFPYDELVARDKVNLDLTWLRDESLEDADNLPAPDVIAREIVEDLTAALAEFEAVAVALEKTS